MALRRWGTAVVTAVVLVLTGIAQPAGATSELARLADANPGSKQISANAIQLANGVTIAKVATTAVDDPTDNVPECPSGHQCAYSDANFGGYVITRPRCVYVDYFKVFFYNHQGVMDDWAFDVSAVYNNIPGVTWSQFWSPRNNANYNAYYRSPAAYVGDQWNDSFTAAQGCSGQAQ